MVNCVILPECKNHMNVALREVWECQSHERNRIASYWITKFFWLRFNTSMCNVSNAWTLNASLCHHAIPGSFCNTQRNIRLIINNCFVIFHSWRNMRRTSPSPMMKQSLLKRPSAVPMLRPQLQQFLSWGIFVDISSHPFAGFRCHLMASWIGSWLAVVCVCVFQWFRFRWCCFFECSMFEEYAFGTLDGNYSPRRKYILFATSKTIDWQY